MIVSALRWVLLLGLVGGLAVTTACQSSQRQKEQLARVDTLMQLVEQAKATMVVKEDSIEKRKDSIEAVLKYINRHYEGDTAGRSLQMDMTDFKGIEKAYDQFLEYYDVYKFENKAHRKRIQALRKDVVQNNLSPDTFRTLYRDEKELLREHLEEVKDLVGRIAEVEPMYQRRHERLIKLYQAIRRRRQQAGEGGQQPS
jgi:Asp-tRNA(Asn)/Glu-tRNA(Gln) amidotransferase C subunit